MTVAAIAYTELKRTDPVALAKVIDILKEHPHYDSRWAAQIDMRPNEDEKNQLLFMLAAKWPDDVRGDQDFDRPEDHFIDFPFKPEGQPASVTVDQPHDENLVVSFERNIDTGKNAPSDADKAVAIAWLFHQAGDVAQPLHTSRLFTTQFPEGDRGGTHFYIRVRPNAETISLHKFWDDLILGSEKFQAVRSRASHLREEHPRSGFTAELADSQVASWAQESFKLSREVAYKNGHLEGSTDRHNGKTLKPEYVSDAKALAERRATLAGYRLAEVLKRL